MRLIASLCLLALLATISGCAMTPGKSPSEIQASTAAPGYIDRAYDSMQPDMP
jgi:hypothetical protein